MKLRISTAGSVDDGKSTLIGRLLYDTKTVFEDQIAAVEKASKRYGDGSTNLALLTDGLRAEREQGITIDVAYRYFATPARNFVVADTPGHTQYTRNMVTGASVSDVAIVLIDSRVGLTEQTRRHLFIVSLLGVSHVVIAVNKMDLVGFDEGRFRAIDGEVRDHVAAFAHKPHLVAIPLSALHGDNVVRESSMMPWYAEPTLLDFLENVDVAESGDVGARMAVQWIVRPHGEEHHDYRGIAGRLSGGSLRVGDDVIVLPSGLRSRVASIRAGGVNIDFASPGRSIAIELEDDIDVGRGDIVVSASSRLPVVAEEVSCDVCWMTEKPLVEGSRWLLKHGTKTTKAVILSVEGAYNVETSHIEERSTLEMNDLGVVVVAAASPLSWDDYSSHRRGGSAILIDESTGATVGALMIRDRSS